MFLSPVPERRTDLDDARIRDWHREAFSGDYPVMDLDCVMVEYDRSKPVAIIEYKHENAAALNIRSGIIGWMQY